MVKLVILFDLHMFKYTCTAIPLKGLNVTWKICDRGTRWQNRVTVCKQHCYTTRNKDLSASSVHVPKRFLHSDSKLAIMSIVRLRSITRAKRNTDIWKARKHPFFFFLSLTNDLHITNDRGCMAIKVPLIDKSTTRFQFYYLSDTRILFVF